MKIKITYCYDCGYTDQAHLTHSLRRILGVTPGQVRGAVSPCGPPPTP